MLKESPHNNNSKTTIKVLAIFSVCLVIFLNFQSQLLEITVYKFIALFMKDLYLPHYNIFYVGNIVNINVLTFFYTFLFLTILITIIIFKFFTDQKNNRRNLSLSQIITTTGIIGLLFLASVQQTQRVEYFINEKNKISGMSTDEKIANLFGWKYQFPNFCQKILDEPHQGRFITDFDISIDPYMFHQRIMAYYLYPKLSMKFDNKSPADCLILYSNKNLLDKVPENYEVLASMANARYILAIKKKEKP